MKALEDQARKL